jgi:tetratricopeptide (TPR) repeat protein
MTSHEEIKLLVKQAIDLAQQKFSLKQYQHVVVILEQASKVDPNNPAILQMLGVAYHALNHNQKAKETLFACLEIEPDNPETLNNIALSYANERNYDKSIEFLLKAIDLNPNGPSLHSNLALQYRHLENHAEAVECLKKSIALREHATTWAMLGGCYGELKRLEEAKDALKQALRLDPNFAAAHVDLASVLHLEGNWQDGFREYEHRFGVFEQLKIWKKIYDPAKRWAGQSLQGKTIIVHTEQGHGDAIHFVRYLNLLRNMKAKVILHCSKVLERLFEDLADQLFTTDPNLLPPYDMPPDKKSLPEHDYHCSVMSIPYLLSMPTVPGTPYLASKRRWDMSAYPRMFKIGIAWAGNPQHPNDRHRSCKLEYFREIGQIPGVKLFSLMKDVRPRAYVGQEQTVDLSANADDMRLVNMSEEMKDFQDTADIIASLNLIISVDTSMVHLAGALDKPTIVLLSWNPDWRWMADGEKSIWYRSMTLIRQSQKGEWADVFKKAKEEVLQRM